MQRRARAGFRFSVTDAVVLAISATLAALVWRLPSNPGAIVLTVVGHFFLFCNVVRLRRSFELVWAASYLSLSFASIALDRFDWTVPLVIIMPLTATLVLLEVRSTRYHGMGWRRINPGWLPRSPVATSTPRE